MRHIRKRAIVLSILILPSAFARADVSIASYKDQLRAEETSSARARTDTYLSGAIDALRAANELLGQTNRPQLFCPSELDGYDTNTVKHGLAAMIKRGEDRAPGGKEKFLAFEKSAQLTMLVLMVLMEQYPCKPDETSIGR